MKNMVIFLLVISFLVVFFNWLPEPQNSEQTSQSQTRVIENVTLFDGETWLENKDVVISEGKIKTIGEKLSRDYSSHQILQAEGKFLLPGLIDAHTHAWGDALSQAVKFGVTTELDMFTSTGFASTERQRRAQSDKDIQQADLFSAGTLVTAPKGHGTEYGIPIETIEHPAEAEQFVQARINEGSDYIKIVYDASQSRMPSIDRKTLDAVVKYSKQLNKLAVVHISDQLSAQHAIEAGANGLVHSFMDNVEIEDLARMMQQNKQFIIPTLSVLASVTGQEVPEDLLTDFDGAGDAIELAKVQLKEKFSQQSNPEAFQRALQNVKYFFDSGVLVLAGTDAPNPGTAHGISLHGELALLVKSGLTPTQAIKAATSNPAKAFDLKDRGFIKVGYKADFLLLNRDPRLKIENTRQIDSVFKNGFMIRATHLSKDPAYIANHHLEGDSSNHRKSAEVPMAETSLGDFEYDLSSTLNTEWQASSDQMMQGNSQVKLARVESEQQKYLQISGQIGNLFAYPWAGAYLALSQSQSQWRDMSLSSSIELKAKGTQGNYRLLIFSTGQPMRPIELTFEVKPEWQLHKLDLTQVPKVLLKSVTAVAIVAGKSHNAFELNLDDIWLR